MAVKVYTILAPDLESAISDLGYDSNVYRAEDIRRAVLRILIADIRSGETSWPVDTGYSQSAFFQRDGALWNEAPYALALENGRRAHGRTAKRRSFIKNYLAGALDEIVAAALDVIGAKTPSEQEPRQSGLLRAASLYRTAGLIIASPTPRAGFLALSRDNRRLLRTFRPGNFLRSRLDARPARDR